LGRERAPRQRAHWVKHYLNLRAGHPASRTPMARG